MKILNKQYSSLKEVAAKYKEAYQNADPFPNIYFNDFFDEDYLSEILDEFPDLSKDKHIKFQNPNEIKLASKGEYRFPEKTKRFMHLLNSQPFLEFLQELTGIEEILVPDPYFEGGGFHQIKPGGLLKIHADFNKHSKTKLDRRINVLVYLNKDWKEEYGGHFELWDREMTKCEKKVPPTFNTMAIFSTTDFSYHGHPNALTCPPDRSRKSLALYYFSNGRPIEEINQGLEDHRTLFVARKGDKTDGQMKRFNQVAQVASQFIPPIITKSPKKSLY